LAAMAESLIGEKAPAWRACWEDGELRLG